MNILASPDQPDNRSFYRSFHRRSLKPLPIRAYKNSDDPQKCPRTATDDRAIRPRTVKLTALLLILAGAEKLKSSQAKASVLLGIWRQSGIEWERFNEIFDGAIASQEVAE